MIHVIEKGLIHVIEKRLIHVIGTGLIHLIEKGFIDVIEKGLIHVIEKEGKVDGSRGRGRRRKSWTTNIAEMTIMRVNTAAKAAMEREGWRSMASNLFKEKEPS
ncbi:hypothetical protein ElyMa_000443300 [Elysia marginata]|uniref:Uncharacterized protein n=1 Tax=Elysia marginata TaxID=1093978 RepID=A0AAV4FPD2_9GAST|nr:hypothetical protein ElyMa_000443300 [Elysia marginata]